MQSYVLDELAIECIGQGHEVHAIGFGVGDKEFPSSLIPSMAPSIPCGLELRGFGSSLFRFRPDGIPGLDQILRTA